MWDAKFGISISDNSFSRYDVIIRQVTSYLGDESSMSQNPKICISHLSPRLQLENQIGASVLEKKTKSWVSHKKWTIPLTPGSRLIEASSDACARWTVNWSAAEAIILGTWAAICISGLKRLFSKWKTQNTEWTTLSVKLSTNQYRKSFQKSYT